MSHMSIEMLLEKELNQNKPFRNEYHKATVNLIYTGKWMMQFVSDLLKPYDITLQQHNVLRILRGKSPVPVTVLYVRDRMLDRMSDASRIIELLRKKGLVERKTNEDNRRKMDIVITQKGIDLLAEIEIEHDKHMDARVSALNELEITQLNQLLDKVRNSK